MTKRQAEILRVMADNRDTEAGELVYERGRGFIGDEPVAARTVFALLRAMWIRHRDGRIGGFERYAITAEGMRALEDKP